ncbi:hypothetical protein MPH_04144 [Macrophomina phaseolina MS6]|uniref:Uncharacterized protein n=1 Tax=Macrophomina phaseolina (strain MS6) TaxID=1126212 RepID=K2S883_MACPH|nr:hypothetical protein MPH_04144 [Macrophomina phaseolina MS6]
MPKKRQRSDPRPTSTLQRSEGSGPIPQLGSSMDSVSPLPDNLSDAGSIESSALFTPQRNISGWPFPSPSSQTGEGGSSLPTSAPAMYGSISPNALMAALSHTPDAAQMSFLNFSVLSDGSAATGQADFLSSNDEAWAAGAAARSNANRSVTAQPSQGREQAE